MLDWGEVCVSLECEGSRDSLYPSVKCQPSQMLFCASYDMRGLLGIIWLSIKLNAVYCVFGLLLYTVFTPSP